MVWWTAAPAIVAEALVAVPDPLLTALRLGPQATGSEVAASLARSLAPLEDPAPPPTWLFPGQVPSFRRALAGVRRYGGALLADPVGSGKTYIALAVAAAFNGGDTTACLVPATLLPQWQSVAAGLGVPIAPGSHEQVSRGRLPRRTRGLVIIDESHHYRNRHTRRYRHLASWLTGRPALLVTATPIVNRLSDLGHQLWLAVRDNALMLDGIVSIRSLLASGCTAAALGQLVVEGEAAAERRPQKTSRAAIPDAAECVAAAGTVAMLRRLRLSSNDSVAALIRGVLLRAAGSSPAALAGALGRYRRLLLHAGDARDAGKSMDRSELRRFSDELGDQLVWWELLGVNGAGSDLELADLEELERQIQETAPATRLDAKLRRLRGLLADGKPTIVFATSRDTVHYLRRGLDGLSLAWCTGDRAGLGSTGLDRRVVLGWFREGGPSGPARHLVVTDVAAEGLDLHRAARVVHYDLPWTPMRLEQREGRAVRLGSLQQEVEVVRFVPPPVLEQSLRLEQTLTRKASLPARAGLGAGGRQLWRWRAELAGRFSQTRSVSGVAAVTSAPAGVLAGFILSRAGDPSTCLSASVVWLEGGRWTEAPETVARRLLAAAQSRSSSLDERKLPGCLAALAEPIRERLGSTRGRHWTSSEPSPSARRLAARLNDLIREAARQRRSARLLRLERALEFAAGGHTAGEAMLVERLAVSRRSELEAFLGRLPPGRTEWDEIEVRLTGLIVFEPG